jgi:hypothetical protein
LAALAALMERKDAARMCSQGASALTKAMARVIDPNTDFTDIDRINLLSGLVQGLIVLCDHLESEEAARFNSQAATALLQAMRYRQNLLARGDLAHELSALGARMAPGEAAAALTQALKAMVKTPEPDALLALAQGLWEAAARAERDEASRLRPEAIAILTQAIGSLAQELVKIGSPGPGLPEQEEARFQWQRERLLQGLLAILTGVDRVELSRRAQAIVALVGSFNGSSYYPLDPMPLIQASEPLRCFLPTAELVELLKQPTCVGPVRRLILDQLQNRYRRRFADHWAFVGFAKEQQLGLDFTTPPKLAQLATPAD